MSYGDLTEAEQAHFNEYQNLRQITNWPGFTAEQDARKRAARKWLLDQRDRIEDAAQHEGKPGWAKAKRKQRFAFLAPANLNRGAPKHEVRLPCPTARDGPGGRTHRGARGLPDVRGPRPTTQQARKQAECGLAGPAP